MNDPNVDEVRRVRDELVKKYGGLEGWIEHLQLQERTRKRKAKTQATNANAPVRGRKTSKRKSASGRVAPPRP